MQSSRFTQSARSTRAPFAQVNRMPVPVTSSIPHKHSTSRKHGTENMRPPAAARANEYNPPVHDLEDEQRSAYHRELEQRKEEDNRIRNIGRIILRFYSPFDDLTDLLRLAIGVNSPRPPKLRADERRLAELGCRILDAFDDLPALINKRGIKEVGDMLTSARNESRATDTLKIRRGVMQWSDWGISAADANDKSLRGWSHEDMAFMLLPERLEYSEDLMDKLKSGKASVSEKDIPRLCFAGCDPSIASGFMKGPVLLRGGASLMRGQEAGVNGQGAPSHTARKYGLTGITDEFIGYTVAQCRYALTDEPKFTFDGSNGFDYRVLYRTILDELDKCRRAGVNGSGARAVDELVQHWNECVFTTRFARNRDVDDDEENAERAEAYADDLARRYGEEADQDEREDPTPEPDGVRYVPDDDEPMAGNYDYGAASPTVSDIFRQNQPASPVYPPTGHSTQLDDGNGYASARAPSYSPPSSLSRSPSPPPAPPVIPDPVAKPARKRKRTITVVEDDDDVEQAPPKRPNTRSQSRLFPDVARAWETYNRGGQGILATNREDCGVKLRPTIKELESLGAAFNEEWKKFFEPSPDKPVLFHGILPNPPVDISGIPDECEHFRAFAYSGYPFSRGSVHVRSRDPEIHPRFDSGFFSNPADMGPLIWQYKICREVARRMPSYRGEMQALHPAFEPGSDAACSINHLPVAIDAPSILYDAEDDAAIEQWVRQNVGSMWHSMGTCAMKSRLAGGVVDPRLNVYGTQGLKIADLSICPSNVSANTASTALAIGEKAACIIAEDLGIHVLPA